MSLFISDAYAQAGGLAASSSVMTFLPMIALFAVFYFLLIRPQQKRQKEHRTMVSELAKGDEIVTMGGMLGKITAVGDNFLTVNIANDTEVKIQKASVQAMMPKGTVKGSA